MKRHIHLRELSHIDCERRDYRPESLARARAAQVNRDLRYDNATGVIRDSTGELSRYCRQSDHEPLERLEDVMRWHFQPFIRNGASRIERGFEP